MYIVLIHKHKNLVLTYSDGQKNSWQPEMGGWREDAELRLVHKLSEKVRELEMKSRDVR